MKKTQTLAALAGALALMGTAHAADAKKDVQKGKPALQKPAKQVEATCGEGGCGAMAEPAPAKSSKKFKEATCGASKSKNSKVAEGTCGG